MSLAAPPLVDTADTIATLFKGLADPTRVRILALLAHGELCVCHIHGLLEAPQPTVSRHLSILRHAGIVRARREGSWMHYSLTDVAEQWLAPALATWRADKVLHKECCSLRACR